MKKITIEQITHQYPDLEAPTKTTSCDILKANGCQRRAQWYGIDVIGPRLYYVYRCSEHGISKKRTNK